MIIKAKANGLDLFTHSEAVKDTAFIFNAKGGFNLDSNIIYWMCIMHDLGKANPLFQSNMDTQDFSKVCRHEISSILFIDIIPSEIKDIVTLSILSHHKSINNDNRSLKVLLDNHENIIFKHHINNIEEWGKSVQKYMLLHYGISLTIPSYNRCVEIIEYYYSLIDKLENGYSLYRGLLMMADHFASCFENSEERLQVINKLFELPINDYYFNKDERYPLSLINSQEGKKHTLCIAPTGIGKTNFMLKRTNGRVFYTLPYQASINAMYQRINYDIGMHSLVGMKHGSIQSISFIDERTKLLSEFYGMPIKIITPFQIMGIILRLKGYESLILDLQGQDIIFDELHTYNSMSQKYILAMINFLNDLGCRIHICTATMPSWLQTKILHLLGEDNVQVVKLNNETLDTFNRHILHTVKYFDYFDIQKRYENGEKILIVRNQVRLAIEIYNEIKKRMPHCKIMLIHSRFKRKDRNGKEELLLHNFNAINEPCIVVSTQVIEVSIDINFDVMFTDNADIMSLIQRFGRVNRQRHSIGVLKDIFVVENRKGWELPYNKEICEKTYEVLQKHNNTVLQEKEIQSIIDYVHESDNGEKYEHANPFNENGCWKQKLYSNVINAENNLSKELNFDGDIGIVESDADEYCKTRDKKMEIPLSIHNIETKLSSLKNENGMVIAYIIPNNQYNEEIGCVV